LIDQTPLPGGLAMVLAAAAGPHAGLDALTISIVAAAVAGVGALVFGEIVRLPSIVFLLVLGILLGPIGLNLVNITDLDSEFGFRDSVLTPLVRLAVAVILFEGGLSLSFRQLRERATGPIRNLLTVGALITWLGAAGAAHLILQLDAASSLLFGAIVIVTGPTVIFPLLRRVRVSPRLSDILRWEGVLIDPIGVVFTIVLLEYLQLAGPTAVNPVGDAVELYAATFALGIGLGLALGFGAAYVLRSRYFRVTDDEHSGNLVALTAAILGYGIGDQFLPDAGLVAATVVGLVLANFQLDTLRDLKRFGGQITQLIVAFLFIYLAADVDLGRIEALGNGTVLRLFAVVAAVILIVRPLNIFASTIGSGLTLREKLFLCWISPRGIVAASLASLLAVTLPDSTFPGKELLEPLVFLTIAATVLIQGFTAGWVARLLGVAEPDRNGYMLVGAHSFGIELASTLAKLNVPVQLVDSNSRNCIRARRRDLRVAKANALDPGAIDVAMLPATGAMLALTINDEVNALACVAGAQHLPSDRLWRAVNEAEGDVDQKGEKAEMRTGAVAFGRPCDIARINALIEEQRARLGIHRVVEPVTAGPLPVPGAEGIGRRPLPLMRYRNRRVEVISPGAEVKPGELVVALMPPTMADDEPSARESGRRDRASSISGRLRRVVGAGLGRGKPDDAGAVPDANPTGQD
jgi:NhaP-type Na+/H+ or K+/H+ antiporter